METVNELSWKEFFRNWLVIKAFKQKLLTINQFNKWSFYFEEGRLIECLQHNSFESSVMPSHCVLFDHLVNNENGRDFVIAVFFVPTNCVLFRRNVSCPHELCIV